MEISLLQIFRVEFHYFVESEWPSCSILSPKNSNEIQSIYGYAEVNLESHII